MMSLLGLLGRHPNQIYVVFVCLGAYASFAEDPFLCTEWLEADQNVLEALFWTANALSVVKHLLSNQLTTELLLMALGCLRVWPCRALHRKVVCWCFAMTLRCVLLRRNLKRNKVAACLQFSQATPWHARLRWDSATDERILPEWGPAWRVLQAIGTNWNCNLTMIWNTKPADFPILMDHHSHFRWELLEQTGKSHELDHNVYHSPSQAPSLPHLAWGLMIAP